MVSFSGFLFIYVVGGLTFIPLVLGLILLHAHLTFPVRQVELEADTTPSEIRKRASSKRDELFANDLDSLPAELKLRTHEPDVAAGYYAVCREYVPGGVNGKPPERTTPAGAAVAAESPSVYQSMYRSIFDRNKSTTPVLETGKGGQKVAKKARNVFYVVLRHNHLMLYDDIEQLEVRHVISLAHYTVDVYAGGETIPEGELWIKRNCIRLQRRRTFGDLDVDTTPFFFFSENCSEKEDFYLAMLASQEKQPGSPESPPTPLQFETSHIIKLVQQLHASEENMQTRWINALIGRIFLSLYKTADVENHIRMKITKKIARVPKPNFISSIKLQKIDMGTSAPFITNPKLKELTVDGDLTVEADVHYKGNIKLEIAAIARIDLGSRLKAREVDLILAGVLRKLEGHLLIRIKPVPSNRLWVSFEKPPVLDLSIEPIVSSRQITYGVILRAIESRIREVMAETIVYPNWDDTPFHDTLLQRFRGGIWEDDVKIKPIPDPQTEAAEHGLVDQIDKESDGEDHEAPRTPTPGLKEKTMSMPSLFETAPSGLKARKSVASTHSLRTVDGSTESAVSSSTGLGQKPTEDKPAIKPKAMRATSFSSASTPTVNLDPATVEALKGNYTNERRSQDATSLVKDISLRSQTASPAESPVGSPAKQQSLMEQPSIKTSASSTPPTQATAEEDGQPEDLLSLDSSLPNRRSTQSSTTSVENVSQSSGHKRNTSIGNASLRSLAPSAEKRAVINQSLTTATAAAKKWFANRNPGSNPATPSPSRDSFTSKDPSSMSLAAAQIATAEPPQPQLGTPEHPIGRGQPLPPPGTPLPGPPKKSQSWAPASLVNLAKRKPSSTNASSTISKLPQTSNSTEKLGDNLPTDDSATESPLASDSGSSTPAPPPLPRRRNGSESRTGGAVSNEPGSVSPKRRPVPPPPLPARRKRSSATRLALESEPVQGDGLLVVAAPVADHSVPGSPNEPPADTLKQVVPPEETRSNQAVETEIFDMDDEATSVPVAPIHPRKGEGESHVESAILEKDTDKESLKLLEDGWKVR